MITTFKELNVYTDSYQLMISVHKSLIKFPNYEQFELSSQIRRASKSIPANLAEGWAKRDHSKEFIKHLNICIGSAYEMQVHIETAGDLGYLEREVTIGLSSLYGKLVARLITLKRTWKPISIS